MIYEEKILKPLLNQDEETPATPETETPKEEGSDEKEESKEESKEGE
ncbi:hypothetical protein IH779_00270 [Patescibacteria group bacterium]|nr:hypothetical protein [Patescibacteria group bacterium]